MNNKQIITRTSIIFTGLTIAGITIAAAGKFMPDQYTQAGLLAAGGVIFGAALTFFLIRIESLSSR